jgi:hypothetical protein
MSDERVFLTFLQGKFYVNRTMEGAQALVLTFLATKYHNGDMEATKEAVDFRPSTTGDYMAVHKGAPYGRITEVYLGE